MNNDEAFQVEYRTRMTRSMSDEEMAREMYEAGQREERERIVRQFEAISQSDDGTCYADYSDAIDAFIDKLRADPAESGE